MKSNFVAFFGFFLANLQSSLGQNEYINCQYVFFQSQYTCLLSILNPNGLDNFQEINGTHMDGRTDDEVLRIDREWGSVSPNIPSIICQKFRNIKWIDLNQIGIKTIDSQVPMNCDNLEYLMLWGNNITRLDHTAFYGVKNLQVIELSSNQLEDFGENVFDTLENLEYLMLIGNRIENLPDGIFRALKSLLYLDLRQNMIKELKIEWFETLENLQILSIGENQFEELPENVFSSLRNLLELWLDRNQLKVIYSDSFSVLPELSYISLSSNQIYAIDERFIDNVEVTTLNMMFNLCSTAYIMDSSASRNVMREELARCFENFENLVTDRPTTTTSIPPDCIGGFLEERVCRLEDENVKFHENIQELRNEDANLLRIIENQQKAIEDLEKMVLYLINNPCNCK